jgi:hypothetical protein
MEETTKKEEAAQKQEAPKKARPTNCAKCNKPLKKKLWYYRNGKHYCGKSCWSASLKTEKAAAGA